MASFKSYLIGFVLSAVLTFAATEFILVNGTSYTAWIIIALAIIQLFVQLIFFLHLGSEKAPRWNLVIFISTVGMVLIVVVGSLWIMRHLNYNMTPAQMDSQLMKMEGMKK